MSWSKKYKRSIDCDNPKGFSQRAHCQGRKKSLREQLKSFKTVEQIARKHRLDVSFIQKQLDIGEPIEHEHTKNHELAREIALQHLEEIPDYYTRLKKMESSAKKEHKKFKDISEEGLRDWFGKSKSKDGKSGWVNVVTGGTCASDEPGEGVPKCVSSAKRASMSKAERLSASRRKKVADSAQQQKSGAAKPTYVSTDSPRKKMKEEIEIQEAKDKPGKGSGKKDACYHKVKSRYSVWPSAYASGALTQCRKKGAANWGTKSEEIEMQRYCPKCQKNETREECKYGPKYWEMFSTPITLSSHAYDPNKPHPANEEKDHEYSMARSELSTIVSATKRLKKKMGKGEGNIEAWVQSKITKAADYLDTAADYVDSGEMKSEGVTLAKGEGGSPYEPYNKPKGPSQPTQPPGGFDKFREKYGIPKKPSLQVAHFIPDNDIDENLTLQDAEGNDFVEITDLIIPEKIKGSVSEKCWDGYERQGMKKKSKRLVPNCIKKEEYSNWREELIISEKWEDKLKDMTPDQIEKLKKSNPGAAEKIDALRKQAKSATPRPVGSGSQLPSVPKSPTTQNRGQSTRAQSSYDRVSAARRQGAQNVAAAQAKRAAKTAAKPSLLKTLSKVKNPKIAVPLAIAGGIYGLLTGPKKQQKEGYSNWREELLEQKGYVMPNASKRGAYSGGDTKKSYKVGDTIPVSATKPKTKLNLKSIRDAGDRYGKSTFSEDWQSANRKDKVDGLSQSTVDKYRKEHPGSKLQTAVTEKKPTGKRAKRRSNFCRRMKGMKSKLTSAKTARDPDSRINKALRRWNCN